MVLLTGSLFYVVFGQDINFGTQNSNVDVKIAGVVPGPITSQIQSTNCASPNETLDSAEQQMLTAINAYRASKGLGQVTISDNLNRAASWMANDMATRNWQVNLGHVDSLGRNYDQRIKDCDFTPFAADIVGYNTSADVPSMLATWEGSPAHNAVLTNQVQDANGGANHQENFTKVGIGRAQANGKWYWSADFGLDDGTTGGGGGTGGGVTACTCLHGGIIDDNGVQNDDFEGQCGHGPYQGTDGLQYTCSDAGWQIIPAGGCINGHIMNDQTGQNITKFYLGTDGQPVCGDDGNEYRCQSGNWNPTNNKCGPNSGGGGTGTGGGGNGQYSLTLTADQTSYAPGGTMLLCYTITPSTAFTGTLVETISGFGSNTVGDWNATGTPNECVKLVIDQDAASGAHEFTANAKVNGQQVATASTTVQITGSNTLSPTTPVATSSPALSPTVSTTTPGVSTNPSVTTNPNPTVTTPPSGTGNLALNITIPGIGTNVPGGANNNPAPSSVALQIQISNPSTLQAINTVSTSLNYNQTNGKFTGSTQIPNGSYLLKVKSNNSLWNNIGPIILSSGQNATAPDATLVTGDLNQDNILDLADYNIFLSCYGSRTCNQKGVADVNQDGKVNAQDLNIFYSGLANRQGD